MSGRRTDPILLSDSDSEEDGGTGKYMPPQKRVKVEIDLMEVSDEEEDEVSVKTHA